MALSRATTAPSRRAISEHRWLSNNSIASKLFYERKLTHTTLLAPLRQGFHTSQRLSSSLFNLGSLSTSRESQYLSKERGIPRTEFSPHLELIRSSEVDTQRAPGSRKASSSSNALPSSKKGNVDSLSSDLVAITATDYMALKETFEKLQQKLGTSEQAARQLLISYQKRTKEGMTLGVFCLFLALAIVYAEEIHRLYTSGLQAWQSGMEEKRPLQEEPKAKTTLPVSRLAEHHTTGATTVAFCATSKRNVNLKQPWALSRLFWATGDQDS